MLAGILFQEQLERAAHGTEQGRTPQVAPAQRLPDFIGGRLSRDMPKSSYHRGIESDRLDQLFPEQITTRMQQGLREFGQKMKGYLTEESVLIGIESRTSSPVRIPRGKESLRHPQIKNLLPCGEGAGFAGGIVSAALDGMKCAEVLDS